MHLIFWSKVLMATALLLQFNWHHQNSLKAGTFIPLISLGPCSFSSNDIIMKQHQFLNSQYYFIVQFYCYWLLICYFMSIWTIAVHLFLPYSKSTSRKAAVRYFKKKIYESYMFRKLHNYSKPTPKCCPCLYMPSLETHNLRCSLYECTFTAIKFSAVPYYHT